MNVKKRKSQERMKDDRQTSGTVYAIIVAAGKGTRMGLDLSKQLLAYGGSTVLGTAMTRFARNKRIDRLIIASPEDGSLDARYREIAGAVIERCGRAGLSIDVVRGGATRADSVRAGLKAALSDAASRGEDPAEAVVLIHDAARPGVDDEIIDSCIDAMAVCRAVTAAVPATDSVRMISDTLLNAGHDYPIITSTNVRRDLVYLVQTPQCFRLSEIAAAHELAVRDGISVTDDASVAEYAGMDVAIVQGSRANTKITTREDIHMTVRVGTGYDVHRLVPGRPLILCGTPIPNNLGLDGHSDADVAAHALMDALLGAAGLGDIGRHFPDTDDRYRGADSMKLLDRVRQMLGDSVISNADITIIAQAPKLAPYMDQMTQNISRVLGIPETAVNVKATTEEGLGFTGRGEGIAAIATCTIEGSF